MSKRPFNSDMSNIVMRLMEVSCYNNKEKSSVAFRPYGYSGSGYSIEIENREEKKTLTFNFENKHDVKDFIEAMNLSFQTLLEQSCQPQN